LSLLAGVPQDPVEQSEDFIYFVDYRAMESAYGAVRPADAEEFADISASDEAHRVWWALVKNIAWSYSAEWLLSLESGPETVGFSPLQVDQALGFGHPPSDGLMLAGSFDADAVGGAYQAGLGLEPRDFDGMTVWCSGEDPAAGFQVDPANTVPENPFGGRLGRRQPMAISDQLLMSSADLEVVLAHLSSAAGTLAGLADVPGYRAAVDAVSVDAEVLQATIAGPAAALQMTRELLSAEQVLSAESGAALEALLADYQELPVFELLILADTVTGDEQIARLGLVYPDAESAELAGPILLGRLATFPSLSGRPFAEELTPASGTGPRYRLQEGTDRAVLVLEFAAPKATSAEIAAMSDTEGYSGTAATPGAVYRRLSNMFLRRDTSWLSTATRAELEALVSGL
jgi:hypothetical protein